MQTILKQHPHLAADLEEMWVPRIKQDGWEATESAFEGWLVMWLDANPSVLFSERDQITQAARDYVLHIASHRYY